METLTLNTAPQFPQQLKPAQYENPDTRFDRFQFDGRPRHIRTADGSPVEYFTGSRMHFERRKAQRSRRWIPEWAMSDEKFRQVLARRATTWSRGPLAPVPETFPELLKMCAEKLARLKAKKYTNPRRLASVIPHIASLEKCGGYLEFITTIGWLSLRTGYEGPIIAEQMGISAYDVRTQLLRLNETAEKLGLVLHVAHHTKGRPRKVASLLKKRATMGYFKFDKPQAIYYDLQTHLFVEKCRSFAWTWREISERIHVPIQGLMDAHKRFADTGYLEPTRPDKRKSLKMATWRQRVVSRPHPYRRGTNAKQKISLFTARAVRSTDGYSAEIVAQAHKLRDSGKTWKEVGTDLKRPWIAYYFYNVNRRKRMAENA